jgi:predicted dehydrogenase
MKEKSKNQPTKMTRRNFIEKTALAAAGISIVPRHVLGGKGYQAPSDKLNIACIGIGGKGRSDSAAMKTENVVALCDVDETQGLDTRKLYPKAKYYRDFRVMLEKENVDAVTVSTPDHNHAIIALTAMQLGKHVFVQKPLTHTVREARILTEAAKRYNVVTQMGNQGHAGEGARLINEWIADGAIGEVYEVHVWTDRPIWPQGMERPKETPPVPETLDWNVWLGPAPNRPYNPAYLPFRWRGWQDFGTGALGDMGAHLLDHPYWALELDAPDTIQASSTGINDESWPQTSMVTWTFPAKNGGKQVKIVWFDGGIMPPRPEDLEPGRRLGNVIYYGTKGKLMHNTYGLNPRLIPETAMQAYKLPGKTLKRSPGIHQEWIDAIKNGGKSSTDFSYSARLTEMMLLGNIAIKTQGSNTILRWNGAEGKFSNLDEANQYLTKKYRQGWEVKL